MWKRFHHRSNLQRNILACLICLLLILLAATILQRTRKARINPEEAALPSLSPDVDSVIRGYHYQDISGQVSVDITGKEAALRGRRIMVFRSNLAKTTYFKTINGSIISKKRAITFTSDTGEWDTTRNSPFILDQNVRLTIDGKMIPGVKSVGIYFNRQTLEVNGLAKTRYTF